MKLQGTIDDGMEQEDCEETDDMLYDSLSNCPPSLPHRSVSSTFSRFISEVVTSAVISLWPENTALILSRFLAENQEYTGLLVGYVF